MGEELFMILRVTKTARAASAGDMLLPNEPTPKAFPRASRARVAIPRFGLRLLLWIPWSSSWRLDGRPSAITKRKTKTTGTSWKYMNDFTLYVFEKKLLSPIELGGLVNPVRLVWPWCVGFPYLVSHVDRMQGRLILKIFGANHPDLQCVDCRHGMGDNAMKKLGV